uniref:Uncharacterized protein n=1 Tax=Sphaerodactylus townsendi TaxID=933632 RepID=A0ACB8FWC0_9SAUR
MALSSTERQRQRPSAPPEERTLVGSLLPIWCITPGGWALRLMPPFWGLLCGGAAFALASRGAVQPWRHRQPPEVLDGAACLGGKRREILFEPLVEKAHSPKAVTMVKSKRANHFEESK